MSEQAKSAIPTPAAPGKPASRERDLIAAARLQAEHRGDSSFLSPVTPPPQHFPGFEVLREIHRGGQGVVYQALQKATKRKVAIKVFHEGPFASAKDRARFEREVDILAQLEHPNIVGIIDRGATESGAFFYVMDYISGKPLDAFLNDPARSIDATLLLFAKICDAVNAAHLKGIIHRDLKPSNIRIGPDGEPHILDFGLAKVAATSDIISDSKLDVMTMTGQFIGSLPWASPEQASGGGSNVDTRTDVYSLGVILYQLLTNGRFPYTVIGNMRDVLDNIIRAEPARPSTIRRQINDEVETIVLKSLAKDRERRYQSAGELGRDVRRYLNGEPIEAKRDSGWYLLGKTISRHRAPFGAAAAFVMLAVASAIGMSVMYQQAAAARDQAVRDEAAAVEAKEQEEEQRRRAEENFEAVRGLARTFIFEFEDDIRNLRGATKARERILTEALAYLQRVKNQAEGDAGFKRELAEAYQKVGDIQAGLNLPNVGGSMSADRSYAEARRLREELLAADPADPRAMTDMGRSLFKSAAALAREQKHDESLLEFGRALEQFDAAMAALPRGDARMLRTIEDLRAGALNESADAYRRLGEEASDIEESLDLLKLSLDRYNAARDYWRGRIAADPADAAAARALGASLNDAARAEMDVAWSRRREAERAAGQDEGGALRILRAAIEGMDRAAALSASAAKELDALSAANPQNAVFRRDLCLARHNEGEAHMRRAMLHTYSSQVAADDEREGHIEASRAAHERSLALYEQALAIAEGLSKADEANLEARRDVAMCLNKVGNGLWNTGRIEEAIDAFERSLEVRREVFQTDATQRHRSDFALGLIRRAQRESDRIERGLAPGVDRLRALRGAEKLFMAALEQLSALEEAGVLGPDSGELRIAASGLEAVRESLKEAEGGM